MDTIRSACAALVILIGVVLWLTSCGAEPLTLSDTPPPSTFQTPPAQADQVPQPVLPTAEIVGTVEVQK